MNSTNIVTVAFNGKAAAYAARPLFQRDRGQILQFTDLDLPASYQVWFSNTHGEGEAVPQIGNENGVRIPDTLIATGKTIYVWIYLQAGADDAETVRTAIILNTPQPTFSGATPTPAPATALDEAIAALNEATEAIPGVIDDALAEAKDSGEFDGADGKNGNIIWWTTAKPIASGDNAGIQRRSLNGPDGLTPAVRDYVFGPAVGKEGEPTTLYVIITSTALVTMTALGSIAGQAGQDGADGTTFTPSVSAAGILSWTNDGGKQDPESVDLVAAVLDALPTWQGGSF